MSSDPIADMLTIIRNGGASNKKVVYVTLAKAKLEILKILKDEGFIEDYRVDEGKIAVTLRYFGKKFAILSIKRISKPGVRIYSRSKKIPKSLGGHGITVVSTPQGVMTDRIAKQKNIGGEVICQVW